MLLDEYNRKFVENNRMYEVCQLDHAIESFITGSS